MRKIKRREKPKRKIKRRKVEVDRLSASGKCKECGNLFLYAFEGDKKKQIESKPKMAKRFKALLDSELCLTCLTGERHTIKAYELMQLHIIKGENLKAT
jgi:hypothetical protein